MIEKLDSREKIIHVRNFLHELKTTPHIGHFIQFGSITETGYLDFDFISRRRILFPEIEKKVKQNKYDTISIFTDDLKHYFSTFSDYLLAGDTLQNEVNDILNRINIYQQNFIEHFKQPKPPKLEHTKPNKSQNAKQKPKQKTKAQDKVPTIQNKKSTFAEKIQMSYFLRTHEDNSNSIQRICKDYGISISEKDNQYVIRLDSNINSNQWLDLIGKKK